MHRFAGSLVLSVLLGWGATVAAQEPGDVDRGRAYAERVCADCHAVRPGALGADRRDAASFAAIANTPGMTAMALTIWLETPHREMPHIIIEPKDRAAVVAYITSLKTPR